MSVVWCLSGARGESSEQQAAQEVQLHSILASFLPL